MKTGKVDAGGLTAEQLRKLYLEYMAAEKHAIIGNASLIPEHDPSVLFTTAGMHPLVPFLLGEPHPAGPRLANVQKCLRTVDIMEVGDDVHLTFFEMLGYWSLGDYGKREAIRLAHTFFTGVLDLDPARLSITCFAGDEDAPRDEAAAAIWQSLGIPPERITYLPREENWWGPVAATGPCGPDTEIFYDVDPAGPAGANPAADPGRFWEIGNVVFIQYDREADGRYRRLPELMVDTGLGFERILTILQGAPSPYETGLFRPLVREVETLAPVPEPFGVRVVADHARAATFILAEGVPPGNSDRPYIARRLIRRAVRYGTDMGIEGPFLARLAATVVETMGEAYPHLVEAQDQIRALLQTEEQKFQRTLRRGRAEFERVVARYDDRLPGDVAFKLYDTYGFPLELTQELAEQQGLAVDIDGFQRAFQAHREKSRRGAAERFRGGLASRQPETVRLHTATHLLHAALRRVLGLHVEQRGSNITVERLRFDFSHGQGLSDEELAAVEALVNEQIARDLPVTWEEMALDEAQAAGATGLFDERYGDRVKVYTIGDFSKEICGGPHVDRTGKLGRFEIVRERSVGAGVRRIRAVLV